MKIMYNIGRQEDIKIGKEILQHGYDMRVGHTEVLQPKLPTY
jgi:hypothetical protein